MTSRFMQDIEAVVVPNLMNQFGATATVSRRSQSASIPVMIDMVEVKSRNNRDVMISRSWSVFIVQASAYVFDSAAVNPQPIDKFTVDGRRYETRTPDGKDQCWEYTDGTHAMLRIFVEEVGT